MNCVVHVRGSWTDDDYVAPRRRSCWRVKTRADGSAAVFEFKQVGSERASELLTSYVDYDSVDALVASARAGEMDSVVCSEVLRWNGLGRPKRKKPEVVSVDTWPLIMDDAPVAVIQRAWRARRLSRQMLALASCFRSLPAPCGVAIREALKQPEW